MRSDQYPRDYFEDGVGSNYRGYGNDPGWAPTVRLLTRVLSPHMGSWLEVACAKGYFVRQARVAGFETVGCDVSDYAISAAPESVRPFVQVANAVSLPWPDDLFALVCSWEFMEHVPEAQLPTVWDEMERVVQPDGWLVHRIGFDDGDSTHATVKPREWWADMLGSRGWLHQPDMEGRFDEVFAGRDWAGRFFVYKAPSV